MKGLCHFVERMRSRPRPLLSPAARLDAREEALGVAVLPPTRNDSHTHTAARGLRGASKPGCRARAPRGVSRGARPSRVSALRPPRGRPSGHSKFLRPDTGGISGRNARTRTGALQTSDRNPRAFANGVWAGYAGQGRSLPSRWAREGKAFSFPREDNKIISAQGGARICMPLHTLSSFP